MATRRSRPALIRSRLGCRQWGELHAHILQHMLFTVTLQSAPPPLLSFWLMVAITFDGLTTITYVKR
eukprot:3720727-Pleurochrysis_carterae.AAC.3